MNKAIRQLFCLHFFEEKTETPEEGFIAHALFPGGEYKIWECKRCKKRIKKWSWWIPINPMG